MKKIILIFLIIFIFTGFIFADELSDLLKKNIGSKVLIHINSGSDIMYTGKIDSITNNLLILDCGSDGTAIIKLDKITTVRITKQKKK